MTIQTERAGVSPMAPNPRGSAARRVVLIADRVVGTNRAESVRALVGRLGALGFSCRIFCSSWGAPDGGVEVEEHPGFASRWPVAWPFRPLPQRPPGPSPLLLHAMDAKMAPIAVELAERWRVPYLQGIEEFLAPGARLRLSRRWCRGLVVPSPELAEDLVENCGLPPGWVRVIPLGLPSGEPVPSARVEGEPRVAVIGAAGPLTGGAGFATLLGAARRVVDAGFDAEFVLIGQGEEEADLRRRAGRLRLVERLTFAGESAVGLSFWDVMDVYCQPSTVPTVGRDLAMAMAHGLPTVASDIGGLRALVAHGQTGLRVLPGDPNALARAIIELLTDRPRARRLGLEARGRVLAEHDLDREAEAIAGLYRSVLDDDTPPP